MLRSTHETLLAIPEIVTEIARAMLRSCFAADTPPRAPSARQSPYFHHHDVPALVFRALSHQHCWQPL